MKNTHKAKNIFAGIAAIALAMVLITLSVTGCANPADSGNKPANSSSKPADSSSKPADSGSKPADSGSKPADSGSNPADDSGNPAAIDGGTTPTTDGTTANPTVSVTGVSLNKSSTSILVNNTETLFAFVQPDNATNKNVTWNSSNTAVATVSGGVVTAVAAGTATITVTTVDGGKTDSCTVNVSNVPIAVTGVFLNKSSTSLVVGNNEKLIATIIPTNATNQVVTWVSSNTAAATVSEGGVITARNVGTATIIINTDDGGKTALCTVTVDPKVIAFSVDPVSAQTYTGNPIQPTVTVKDGSTTLMLTTDYTTAYINNTNAGTATVTISGAGNYAGSSGSAAFTINKVNPSYTVPQGLTAVYGQTLANVTLSAGWAWVNPASSVGNSGNQTHNADFTPTDTANYNVINNIAVTVTVAKAAGASVSAPTLNTKTHNSITINAVSATTGQTVEYGINTGNTAPSNGWQTGTTFSGLNAGTTYYIFAHAAENSNYETGTASGSLAVTTLQTASPNRIEYYWVNQYGVLVTTGSNTATVAAGATLTITAQGTGYTVNQWYLDGLGTGQNGIAYNFSSPTSGVHTVSLFVEKDGKLYNTTITITVQ